MEFPSIVSQKLTPREGSYGEAIECLKDHYDCPGVTHHEHVQSLLQAPIMKGTTGRELNKLNDVHVRMEYIMAIMQAVRSMRLGYKYVPHHHTGIED